MKFYMKKWIRNIWIFICIVVFIIAFSSSYLSLSMDNLAYVLAIGIDKSEENMLQVSFEFSTTSKATESGSMEKTPTVLNSVTASSISTAINLMNSYLGKELNMSHCKIIIFSEELASEGISEEIYTLINDTEIRPSANLVVSKCTAKQYMKKTSPELENLISKYYENFTNSSQYSGFIPNSTIGDFFNALISETSQPYAILGGLTEEKSINQADNDRQENYNIKANEAPIEGKNQSENIGMAVFKNDKLVGELSAMETISFLTINNKIDRFLISIPDPYDHNHYLDIYISPNDSTKVKIDTSTSSPYIKVNTNFTGRIYSMSENSKYLDPTVLDTISHSCNRYLESILSDYLYKTAKDFKSDINDFGVYALGNFFTTEQVSNYNWLDNYKNSFFDVYVDTSIKSGMLMTET